MVGQRVWPSGGRRLRSQRCTAEVEYLDGRREDLGNAVCDGNDHSFGLIADHAFYFLNIGTEFDHALHGELGIDADDDIVSDGVGRIEGDVREQLTEGRIDVDIALGTRFEQRGDDSCGIDVGFRHHDQLHQSVGVADDHVDVIGTEAADELQVTLVGDLARSARIGIEDDVVRSSGASSAELANACRGICGSGSRIAVDGETDGLVEEFLLILHHDTRDDGGHELDRGPADKFICPVELNTVLGDGVCSLAPSDLDGRELTALIYAEAATLGGGTGADDGGVVDVERLITGRASDRARGGNDLVDVGDQVHLGPEGSLLEEYREQDGRTGAIALEKVLAGRSEQTAGNVRLGDDAGKLKLTFEGGKRIAGLRRLNDLEVLPEGHAEITGFLVVVHALVFGGHGDLGSAVVAREVFETCMQFHYLSLLVRLKW